MILAKYNQSKTIHFDLYQPDGVDFESAATFAAGDVTIMLDEAAEVNTTNLPTDEGQGYSLVLTAAEMSASRIKVYIVDQTATKVWLDTSISLETYGNAAAEHEFDFDSATTPADVVAISGDSVAADNLESQYDGTGLTGGTFPSSQDQLGSLSVGSASISTVADSYTLTTGTQSAGTVTDTETVNDVRHEHTDATGAMELYYEFLVGGSSTATDVTINGHLNSNNDVLSIYAYNWIGASWDQIGTLVGKNGSTDDELRLGLLSRHTGTGTDSGKVRVRFFAGSGLTSATLRVDRIIAGFTVVANSIGYDGGAIWIDGDAANTGTEAFVDGVADNPVSTLAAADTLASSVNVKRFRISRGTSIQLLQTYTKYEFDGIGYSIDLNGQTVEACSFRNAILTGVCSSVNTLVMLQGRWENVTLPTTLAEGVNINGTLTLLAGDYTIASSGGSDDGSAVTVQYGATTGNTEVFFRDWLGGDLTIENMGQNGTDSLRVSGYCENLTISASCTGGTLVVAGNVNVIDNSGGAVTITTDAKAFQVASENVSADIISISGDTVAADNLELQFDGTGLVGDTFPSTQSQLSNIALTGSAVSKSADSYVLTTGTQSSGTVADTVGLDGVYHEHTDDAGTLDLYYEFGLGGDGIPTAVDYIGYLTGNNDTVNVYAYDWDGASWDIVGTLVGQTGTTNLAQSHTLFQQHVGTGVNLGLVRIRFEGTGLTTATLAIDQIFTAYAIVTRSVGYANGAVWIDTNNGTAGVEAYVNGTADNPSLTLADALAIAAGVGLNRFQVTNGSIITFAEAHTNETWNGEAWSLALGNQDISGSFIAGATVTGVGSGAVPPHLEHCEIGTCTLPPCRINGGSGFTGTATLSSTGDYDIIDCTSLVAGGGAPTIDLGAAGAQNVNIRDWSGGIELNSVAAGDTISMEGIGGTITVNGTGGSVFIRGIYEGVIDNSSAAVAIVQTAMLNRKSISGYENSAVWINTSASNTNTIDYVDGTADNPVSTIAAATTVATSLGLTTFNLLRGSTITLAQTYNGFGFEAGGAMIDLGGQDFGGSVINRALVTGTATGSLQIVYANGKLTNVTTSPAGVIECSISGTLTLGAPGNYTLNSCYDSGDMSPAVIDFGVAVGDTHAEILDWRGKLELQNLGQTGSDTVNITGAMQDLIINANCTGGTVTVAGFASITDNSGGAVTIIQDAKFDRAQITDIGTDVTSVKEVTDSAQRGNSIAGTLSTTQMTTDLTEVTNDHYVGRLLTFTSGALNRQQTDITDYDGTTKTLTFTALTEAPAAGVSFILT